jgi:hypothetical protein
MFWALELSFDVRFFLDLATVLATFQKIGQFSQSSGHCLVARWVAQTAYASSGWFSKKTSIDCLVHQQCLEIS